MYKGWKNPFVILGGGAGERKNGNINKQQQQKYHSAIINIVNHMN